MSAALLMLWLVWLTDSIAAVPRWLSAAKDVHVYWLAGQHLRAGADLYQSVQESPNGRPYLYPPALAVLFAVLSSMPPVFGMAMWAAIHVMLLFALTRLIGPRLVPTGFSLLSAQLLVLLFLSGPLAAEHEEGQVNLLVTLLMGAGFFQLLAGRDRSAGVLLACAVHVKILPVVTLLGLVFGKQYRAAKWMLITGLLLVLLPALAAAPALGFGALPYTVEQHWRWLTDVFGTALVSGNLDGSAYLGTPNLSLEAVLSRWFSNLQEGPALLFVLPGWLIAALWYLCTATLAGVATFGAWRDRAQASRLPVWALLLFVAIQLSNLLCWPHHLMSPLLILVFGLLVLSERRRRSLMLAGVPYILLFSTPTLIAVVASFFDWTRPIELYAGLLRWGVPTLASLAIWVAAALLLLQERKMPAVTEPESSGDLASRLARPLRGPERLACERASFSLRALR